MLIEELTSARGISGDEHEIRELVKNKVINDVDEVTRDTLGNLFAIKKGNRYEKKVMLTAHMDEVGYMITAIVDSGMLKFSAVGMWMDDKIIVSKRVIIGKNKIPGVVGIKPIHMQEADERKRNVKIKQLYIRNI